MLWRVALAGLVALGVLFGGLHWRAASYGAGPKQTSGAPASPVREIAFVANAVEGTVTLIDIAEARPIGMIDIKPDGTRVSLFRDPAQWIAQPVLERSGGLNYAQDTDLSRDGTVLYVSRGHLADVVAIDLSSGDILWRTPIAGVRADHMDMSPDGRRLFVSAVIDRKSVV